MMRQKGTWIFAAMLLLAVAGVLWWSFPAKKSDGIKTAVFGGWQYSLDDQKVSAKVLAKQGLTDYRWEDGRLLVPALARSVYESALAAGEAFPKAPSDVKRESIREMGPFESSAKSQLRDLNSSAWQLEQTLEQFSTKVGYATVGVRARREQEGMISKTIVTASVGVWLREDEPISPELLSAITLATRHHLGIDDDSNVSILDLRHGCSYLGTNAGIAKPETAAEARSQEEEEYWQQKVETVLNYIPGIRVSAVYSPEYDRERKETTDPDVLLARSDSLPVPQASLGNPRPRTVVSNYPAAPDNPSYAADYRSDESRPTQTPVSLTIAVPSSYIRKTMAVPPSDPTRSPNTTQLAAKGQEILADIRRQVWSLLEARYTSVSEEDAEKYIHLTLFSDEAEPVPEPGPEATAALSDSPSAPEKPVFWKKGIAFYEEHQAILIPVLWGLGGLVLVGILIFLLRRVWRRPSAPVPAEISADVAPSVEAIEDHFESSERPDVSGSVQQKIQDLVKNNPDQAVRIIQQWIRTG